MSETFWGWFRGGSTSEGGDFSEGESIERILRSKCLISARLLHSAYGYGSGPAADTALVARRYVIALLRHSLITSNTTRNPLGTRNPILAYGTAYQYDVSWCTIPSPTNIYNPNDVSQCHRRGTGFPPDGTR